VTGFYYRTANSGTQSNNSIATTSAQCDVGDTVIAGGWYGAVDHISRNYPSDSRTWTVRARMDGTGNFDVYAMCADTTP